jgi:EpsI family protein
MVSFLCMLACFVFVQRTPSSSSVEVIEKNLDRFPYQVGDFIGTDIRMEDAVVKELNTDVCVYRKYADNGGEEITLYIGYYGTKRGGRTGHNPGGCYPGSGWAILDEAQVKVAIALNGNERKITLNALQVKKGGMRERVYHWYQSNGDEVLSDGIDQNLHRFKSKILYNRNDGAFIRVSAIITESLSHADGVLRNFIRDIFPLIVKHWPEEKEM